MAREIQRVPRALSNILGNVGVDLPADLSETLQPSIETLQLYGLNQLTPLTGVNAAAASGTVVQFVVPDSQVWIMFGVFARVVEQVAMTFCDVYVTAGGITLNVGRYNGPGIVGREATSVHVPPYPKILLPGNTISALSLFAGVANVNLGVTAIVGVLG